MDNTKKKHRDIITWVLGILLLILSFFVVFHVFSFSDASHRIFSKRVQKAVYHQEDLLQAKAELLQNYDFSSVDAYLYVFKKDSLLYWNSNLIEPKQVRKRIGPNADTIINLNVGDFLVTSAASNDYSFYLCSLLNTTYPIENKFFINRFQPMVGNHKIQFGVSEDNAKAFPVYSLSGKLLSHYTIDFPTIWGSSNQSFLIVCGILLLLCTVLLVLRLAVLHHGEKEQTKNSTKTVSIWAKLACFVVLVMSVFLVWLGFSRLFQFGFSQNLFIPNSIQINYAFLALVVAIMALVALAFVLRWLLNPWISGRNELLVMIGQMVFWSILLTIVYNKEYIRYDNLRIQETARMLSEKREPDFELSYQHFLEESQADTTFNTMILSDDVMAEVAMDYMRYFLFDSVMNRFNVTVTLGTPLQELEVEPFVNDNHGLDLGQGLYYLDENTLDPHYLSVLTFRSSDSLKYRTLYLEFSRPVIPQGFGLPKLLSEDQANLLVNVSVACYRDGFLMYKNGSYVYPNYFSEYKHPINEFSYGRKMKHYVHLGDDNKVLAISLERRGWREITSPFVVFFFLLLVLYLLVYFVGGKYRDKSVSAPLSRRVQMVVLVALGVSFLLVGPVSVIYLRSLYTQKVNETHFDRTRTLSLAITSEVDFSFLKEPGFKTTLDEILRHYSETFFTDINVYDANGKMLATTSPEITELQIQSSLMNADAFHNMRGERMLFYINEEAMGKAVYQSSYIAIQDNTGNTLVYLNIPNFTSRSDLRSEIVYYILTYINIVLLIIFIFIPVVLVITRKITDPLVRLQEKMQRIDLNKSNEMLEWKRNDEIGALINQYNQLVVKLEESAAELRRTAAESAWRGVARQVAHEIHNSLTPMRLSIQMLQRSAAQEGGEVDERFQRTAATLLEQIDALSDIASSFSQYAKLPVNNPQPFDLAELVGNVVNLYDNTENINFHYDFDDTIDHTINGDKTNLNSAIGNIIKNATQAIGSKPDGKIDVALKAKESTFVISVKDNGKGIKEEDKKMIFVPNFTTKTGGSGVGLSLTYNIIQSARGTITFESREGEGTEFVITLPK